MTKRARYPRLPPPPEHAGRGRQEKNEKNTVSTVKTGAWKKRGVLFPNTVTFLSKAIRVDAGDQGNAIQKKVPMKPWPPAACPSAAATPLRSPLAPPPWGSRLWGGPAWSPDPSESVKPLKLMRPQWRGRDSKKMREQAGVIPGLRLINNKRHPRIGMS